MCWIRVRQHLIFACWKKMRCALVSGHNHRMGLYDMIMLKDNHIDYCGGLEKLIELAWRYAQQVNAALKIESGNA